MLETNAQMLRSIGTLEQALREAPEAHLRPISQAISKLYRIRSDLQPYLFERNRNWQMIPSRIRAAEAVLGDVLDESGWRQVALNDFGAAARRLMNHQIYLSSLWDQVAKFGADIDRSIERMVALQFDHIGSRRSATRQQLYLVVAVSIVIALLVMVGFERMVAAPIQKLSDAAGSLAQGDLEQEVRVAGHNEISALARAFNLMARQVQESTNSLERRVEERTAELEGVQEELLVKARLAVLGQLTGSVAHELRNPLGAIATSNAIIVRKLEALGIEDVSRATDRIGRNIHRCDMIVTELLDFAKAKGLVREPTALDAWLPEVLNDQDIPDGLTLTQDLSGANVVVDIDRERLRRAITNLINNACDALMDEAGLHGDGEITVSCRASGERAAIEVADNGPGIGRDILPDVLKPLFSTKSFGFGLGLPTVVQILEEHGGGLEISTPDTGGTRMVLWLPLAGDRVPGEASS